MLHQIRAKERPSLVSNALAIKMKLFDRKSIERGTKMKNKAAVASFVLFGIASFLLLYLFLLRSRNTSITSWKVALAAVGGTIFVGIVIFIALRFGRYILIKATNKR